MKIAAKFLRWLRLLRFDYLVSIKRQFPNRETLNADEVVVVSDGGICKWACFLCPGGCGDEVALSLNEQRRPRWRIMWDSWKRPTIEPSVHRTNACGCHFFLRQGQVEWCIGGKPAPKTELDAEIDQVV